MKENGRTSDNTPYVASIKKISPCKLSTYEKPPIVYFKKCLF